MNIRYISLLTLFAFLFSCNLSFGFSNIKKLQKSTKASKIEFNPRDSSYYKAYFKKTEKWALYYNDDQVVPPVFDSIGWVPKFGTAPFSLVKNQDQYGILLPHYEVSDAHERVECQWQNIQIKKKGESYFAVIQQNNKWGLIDWFEGYTIFEPTYNSASKVPLVHMDRWQVKIKINAERILGADIVEFDPYNGDGAMRIRIANTQKCGMFQAYSETEFKELIPAQYDSLHFFRWNGKYTTVFNNGKLGLYLSKWSYDEDARETIPCVYDELKFIDIHGFKYLAVRKDDMWAWADWRTGEIHTDFIYSSLEKLPNPSWKQSNW